MKIIVDSVARLPAALLTPVDVCRIETDLTFKTVFKKDYGFGQKDPVRLYAEAADGSIEVPRRYDLSPWTARGRAAVDARPSLGSPVSFSFRDDVQSKEISKKQFQDDLVDRFLVALSAQPGPFRGGILSAPCGSGKTAMSIKISNRLGRTVLVLVNKDFLQRQWLKEFCKFTDLAEADIGLVKQKKCQFEGKKVVIASIQSVISREYPQEFYRHFGVVLLDECHRVAAPRWSRASMLFPAAHRIGVSATPRRKDGLTKVLDLTIGGILAKGTRYGLVPSVYQFYRHTYIDPDLYYRAETATQGEKTLLARFLNYLVRKEARNAWLADEMIKACDAGRKIFILSDRRAHLEILKDLFDARSKGRYSSGFYVGGMKQKDLDVSAECAAIFGTYSMASEALDIPAMDTLFLTTPHSDVEQPTGRILRNHDGKKTPVVIDVVDDTPFCVDWGQKRLRQYERLDYNVRLAPDYSSLSKEQSE